MDTFTYHGETLTYLDHPYNHTRLNERAVEVPVALSWLQDGSGCGLEVGNVLGHYTGRLSHRVVDLYEVAEGVENVDVFSVRGAYDWVLAISTLEHVYWDTRPRRKWGAVQAIAHLRGLLAPGGRMLVTVPMGHHQYLDRHLLAEAVGTTRACTLVREGDGWRQTPRPEHRPYGASTPWAEAVWIGEWQT